MILVASKIFRKNFVAMAVYPFILLKDKSLREDLRLLNHEKIHLRQQLDMLVFPFYIWYFSEYFIRLIQYKNGSEAYLNISFEREAYRNEGNPDYLKNRRWFGFLKYL